MSTVSSNLVPKINLRLVCVVAKEVLVWILSYIFIIHFFIFTTPFVIYRKAITIIAKLYDKDITKIITGLSAIFHRDFDNFHKKPLHAIVTCLRIKGGTLTPSGLQKVFMEKVIRKKDPEANDRLAYPELQQYFTRFMGYSFLKWDRKFDIENHVTAFRDENEVVVTRSILMELWQNLLIKPFPKERSAWEMILIENYVADEREEGENAADWIVFIRLHHGIADGFCFEKILCSLFDSDYVPDFISVKSSSNGTSNIAEQTNMEIQKLMMNLRCLAMGPYDLVNRAIRHAEDFHSLHLPAEKKSFEYFVVESKLIPVKEIKEIKRRLGVGFTTVLLEVASGGIRRFLKSNSMPLPQLYTTAIPYPSLGRRRDKLENDFLLAVIDLPIGQDNLDKRLLNVEQSLKNLRHSSFMIMLNACINRIGNIPSAFLRAATAKSMVSTSYATIPGPEKIVRGKLCGGCTLLEANFVHGLSSDSLGLVISSITFSGNLRMTLCVDRNLMKRSREMAEQFVKCLMEEYIELKKYAFR